MAEAHFAVVLRVQNPGRETVAPTPAAGKKARLGDGESAWG